jgi:hypothetical protein
MGFLEAIMSHLGFADRWIRLILMCVKSTTYTILVNGTSTGQIFPTRGIQQGDPISAGNIKAVRDPCYAKI